MWSKTLVLQRLPQESGQHKDVAYSSGSNQNFQGLQVQLEGTENRVAQSRREYNEFTTDFNRAVRTFPRSLISGIFGFEKRALYVADPASQDAPKVDLTPSGS